MDAFDLKVGIIIGKLNALGQGDKTLQLSTDELANQKKQQEESAAQTGASGAGGAGMRDLTDKV